MSSLGTLSLDFLVNLNNSMAQVGQLEARLEALEQAARDSRRAVDDVGNGRIGNIASQFDAATESLGRFRNGLSGVLSGQGGLGDLVGAFQGVPPQALAAAAGIAAIGAAAAGAGIAIASSINHVKGMASEISATSQASGVSAENLQKLRYAAQASGVEADALTDAFKEINITLSEGNESDRAKMLDKMGIAMKDASGNFKSADQILVETADTFAAMPSDTERAALAMKLFGEEGTKLLPFLKQGQDGIKQLGVEAQNSGSILGGEAIAGSKEYSNSILKLQKMFEGIQVSIGTVFMPAATAVIDVILEIAKAFKDVMPDGASFKGLVMDLTKQGLLALINAIEAGAKRVASFGKLLSGVAPIIGVWITSLMNTVNGVMALIEALDVFRNIVQGSVLFIFGELIKATGSFFTILGEVSAAIPGLGDLGAGLQNAGAAARTAGAAVSQFSSLSFEGAASGLGAVQDRLSRIGFDASENTKAVEGFAKALERAGDVDLSKARGVLGSLGEGGPVKLETDNETQKTLADILKELQTQTDNDKKSKAALAKPEKLSTPALYEKLTGGKFPANLAEDPEALKSTEEFNKRREKALENLLKLQKQNNAQYEKQQAAIKAATKAQGDAKLLAESNVEAQKQLGEQQAKLAGSAKVAVELDRKFEKLKADEVKKQKEITDIQDNLKKALREHEDNQRIMALVMGGMGGFSGGMSAGGAAARAVSGAGRARVNPATGRVENLADDFVNGLYDGFSRAIDKAAAGQFGGLAQKAVDKVLAGPMQSALARTSAIRSTPIGPMAMSPQQHARLARGLAVRETFQTGAKVAGGAAGGAAGTGFGAMIGGMLGRENIEMLENSLALREQELAAIKEQGKETKKLGIEAGIALDEFSVNLNKSNELRIKEAQLQQQIAANQDNFNKAQAAAGSLQAKNQAAQAAYGAQVAAINAEQIAVQIALNAASDKKRMIDEAIARILEIRTEMANNELNLSEEEARIKNLALENEMKMLEIKLQDVSAEERKVLILEQQVAYEIEMRGIRAEAVANAKEAVELARQESEEMAKREKVAQNEFALTIAKDGYAKAGLQLAIRQMEIEAQNLTFTERELALRQASLQYEEAITAEKIKQVEAVQGGISGVGGITSQFGGMMEKLGFDKETSRIVNEIGAGIGGIAQGAGGVAQIMAGDLIGGITNLASGALTVFESIFDIFDEQEEEIDPSEYSQITIDKETIREQAREFAQAFVDEQERRLTRPVQITVDARGALVGEENEVARALGNLLERELGNGRIGNINPRGL